MHTISAFLKTAGCVATIVGATAVAAPAQAGQASISLSFGGGAGPAQFGLFIGDGPQHDWRDGRRGGGFDACMGDGSVLRALREQGYRRVTITDTGRRNVEAEADYGRYHYVLDVNRCTGVIAVLDRDRIRGRSGVQFSPAGY